MQSYRDVRNQRKLAKVGGSVSGSQQMFGNQNETLQSRKSLGGTNNQIADVEMNDGEVEQDDHQNQPFDQATPTNA